MIPIIMYNRPHVVRVVPQVNQETLPVVADGPTPEDANRAAYDSHMASAAAWKQEIRDTRGILAQYIVPVGLFLIGAKAAELYHLGRARLAARRLGPMVLQANAVTTE